MLSYLAPLLLLASSAAADDGYGRGGRYGFKTCNNRGFVPGKVSCLNFDAIAVEAKDGVQAAPGAPLAFSPQWSVANTSALAGAGHLPARNAHAAVSPPNALLASRHNPRDRFDAAAASFAAARGGAFDLFGFYVQPMALDPAAGIPGIDVLVRGFPAAADAAPLEWAASFPAARLDGESVYFDALAATGELWDALDRVEVSAALAGVAPPAGDWEVWVDDVWLRWGKEEDEESQVREGADERFWDRIVAQCAGQKSTYDCGHQGSPKKQCACSDKPEAIWAGELK